METSAPAVMPLSCAQCGGELRPDEGQRFLTCPYCGSTVFVDRSRVVFHWYLAATIDEGYAGAALARWMAGNETVKDLDRKARVLESAFAYFPLWVIRAHKDGKERQWIEPAAATSVGELKNLRLPAGDLRNYVPEIDAQAVAPTVPLEAVKRRLVQRGVAQGQVVEFSLVHVPLYTFKYLYDDRRYTAVVEGASGAVFADLFPAKAEAPYRLVGVASAAVFLCLATFPLIGFLAGDEAGLGTGLLACSLLGGLAVPLFFALATWVASKV